MSNMQSIIYYSFLAADILLVYLICRAVNKYWKIPKGKLLLGACLTVPVGLFGSKVMRLIETGSWSGMSFYGAVFITPLIMIPLGMLFKTKPKVVLDIGAPVACAVQPFMKIQCYSTGCCFGRIIRRLPNGRVIRFPSQIVEMICGVILLFVILKIEKSKKQRGFVYAWFLLLYGSIRFVLNFLRETKPFVLGIPSGCLWSIISICIGGGVLLFREKIKHEQAS